MIVRDDGGLLQLGPEIPLFHWFYAFSSDVAWTGSLYVVAWRYEFLQTRGGWIGISRISQSGVPFGSLVSPTAGPAESGPPLSKVSVAANDAGEAAVVLSEMAPPTYVARARIYLMSEMAPMPAAPEPPRNAVAYRAGTKDRDHLAERRPARRIPHRSIRRFRQELGFHRCNRRRTDHDDIRFFRPTTCSASAQSVRAASPSRPPPPSESSGAAARSGHEKVVKECSTRT